MNLHLPEGFLRRVLYVVAAVAIAAGIIGFVTGTRRVPEVEGYQLPSVKARSGDVVGAPSQSEIAAGRFGLNRTRHPVALGAMADDHPGLMDVVELSEEEKRAEVERRAGSRAYEGAPPTIPHPIEQRGYPSCSACHAEGLRVEGKVARPMSHPLLQNCTQCHIVESRPMPTEPADLGIPEGNSFVGTRPPMAGETAWEGAPPIVPHHTFMRENCSSCHGVWATGIRTSHPWRQSCNQCHASSAARDQRPQAALGGPPPVGGAP